MQVVHDAAAVDEKHEPNLDEERRTIAAPHGRRMLVDALAEPEPVPYTAYEHQAAAVGQIVRVMPEPKRRGVPLHLRARWDTMMTHRLGASL
ncbi:MAG: hypothetical protein M3373_02015 [Gemmatimonadota bacterium]|nr:hypothetical protein [Gemmatimonadota bacterium]